MRSKVVGTHSTALYDLKNRSFIAKLPDKCEKIQRLKINLENLLAQHNCQARHEDKTDIELANSLQKMGLGQRKDAKESQVSFLQNF